MTPLGEGRKHPKWFLPPFPFLSAVATSVGCSTKKGELRVIPLLKIAGIFYLLYLEIAKNNQFMITETQNRPITSGNSPLTRHAAACGK